MMSKALLLLFLFLLVSSTANVNAYTLADDDSEEEEDDDTTTTEEENDDDQHEPDHERDESGTVWVQTDIMTIRLDAEKPIYQYWYTPDVNGSLSRFQVSYLMVVEFEDQNGDGVYQINETIQFAPLDAFDWTLKTGAITDSDGKNTEVYASYTKGGLTGEDWDDDWFEDWMPGYSDDEDNDDQSFLADDEGEEDEEDTDDNETLSLDQFKTMTMQFYAHIYAEDHFGKVRDDEGIQANYTISGGVELKIDIEIGNFPYQSNTSKVAVLNYIQEDVASDGENHYFELHEDDHDEEIDSEDEWEISDDLGEKFFDDDENDIQELSLIEANTNTTRGFYRWLDKAVQTLPNGSKTAVDVDASYWANGNALLLFFAYPNFDGGSVLHDPSMKFIESASPVPLPTGSVLEIPLEITIGAAALSIATIAIIGVALKRR